MDPVNSGEEVYSYFSKERNAFTFKYMQDALNTRHRFGRKPFPHEEWKEYEKRSNDFFDYKLRERQIIEKQAKNEDDLVFKAFPATLMLPTYLMEEAHDLNTKTYLEAAETFTPFYMYQEQMFNFYPRNWTIRRKYEPAILEVFRQFEEKKRLKEQNQEGAKEN